MSRPTTKAQLQEAAAAEYARLTQTAQQLFSPEGLADVSWQADIDDQSRNPRDVWCHLHAWHEMTHEWVTVGCTGGSPAIPGVGLTWHDTPIINARIWDHYHSTSWQKAVQLLDSSHVQMMQLIASQPETCFEKKVYPWTGTTSVGAYLVSATSSHYAWGTKTLKAIAKAR